MNRRQQRQRRSVSLLFLNLLSSFYSGVLRYLPCLLFKIPFHRGTKALRQLLYFPSPQRPLQGLNEQEAAETTENVSSLFLNLRKASAMHPLYNRGAEITHGVIGAAIEVHKDKGPGLLESIYEWCLTMELQLRGHTLQNQESVIVRYKQFQREEPLRFDLLIDRCLLVEGKSVERVLPIHKAQLLSYMKLLDVPLGLIINFNVLKLTDGVSRLILPGANLQ